jgi:hypothetical protein
VKSAQTRCRYEQLSLSSASSNAPFTLVAAVWSFSEAIDPALPRVAAGCYTIWDNEERHIYAGMAGRKLTAEYIEPPRVYAGSWV